MSEKTIVLIACVKQKLPCSALAKDLFISPLFRMSLEYAESLRPDAIYILSAEYNLIPLQKIVEPYDVDLKLLPILEVRRWADEAVQRLRQVADLGSDHFVFLAGKRYRQYIIPQVKSYNVPMKGLGIGKQLQFLKTRTGTQIEPKVVFPLVNIDPRIVNITVTEDSIVAELADGRTISVPLAWSWRLSDATPEQRNHFEIIGAGEGVHWPDIDEDVSAWGMLSGVPARPPRRTAAKATRP